MDRDIAFHAEKVADTPATQGMPNLLDSERVACMKILQEIQLKYSHKPAYWHNLESMAAEVRDRYASEVNLDVEVDWIGPSMAVPPQPPTINVVGRIRPIEFDHDQMRTEVQKGIADQLG